MIKKIEIKFKCIRLNLDLTFTNKNNEQKMTKSFITPKIGDTVFFSITKIIVRHEYINKPCISLCVIEYLFSWMLTVFPKLKPQKCLILLC